MKHTPLALALAALVAGTSVAEAKEPEKRPRLTILEAGAETFVHPYGVNGDIKLRLRFPDIPGTPVYFQRFRPSIVEGKVAYFSINELMFSLPYNVRLGGQARLVGDQIVPAAAVGRYTHLFGPFSLFSAVRGLFPENEEGINTAAEIHLMPKYATESEQVYLETISKVDGSGFVDTRIIIRGGPIVADDVRLGIGLEVLIKPDHLKGAKPQIQPGVYIKIGK